MMRLPADNGVASAADPAPRAEERKKVNRVLQLVHRALSVSRVRSEDGQTMAEYGVILAVISASVLAALLAFNGAVQTAFQVVNETVSAVL
jgi:Flp pilus assembly pilin Flp